MELRNRHVNKKKTENKTNKTNKTESPFLSLNFYGKQKGTSPLSLSRSPSTGRSNLSNILLTNVISLLIQLVKFFFVFFYLLPPSLFPYSTIQPYFMAHQLNKNIFTRDLFSNSFHFNYTPTYHLYEDPFFFAKIVDIHR